jgi:hypothetical protein
VEAARRNTQRHPETTGRLPGTPNPATAGRQPTEEP